MIKIASFIVSIVFACIIMVIMKWLNNHILITKIPEFMIGWISCGFFWVTKDYLDSND